MVDWNLGIVSHMDVCVPAEDLSVAVELVAGHDGLCGIGEGEGGMACEGDLSSFTVRWVEATLG